MKNKGTKMKFSSDSIIMTLVVASASVAIANFANGRNLPVVFVEPDANNKIDNLLAAHQKIDSGDCFSQWGVNDDGKTVSLIITFNNPIEEKILLMFDIVKFGIVVDQILFYECMYLMTGNKKSKLSTSLNKDKILLEIPKNSFEEEWNKVYKNTFAKHLQKTHKLSKKDAYEVFDKLRNEANTIQKIRIK